jgi:LPS-assembly protein
MPTKSKLFIILLYTFSLINFFYINLYADEFNLSAVEVSVDKSNNIVIGKGSVVVTDSDGRIINADKITYDKSKEFLKAEGSVKITNQNGSILKTKTATYDKPNEIIVTYDNSELILKTGHTLKSNLITFETTKKVLSSSQNSVFTDIDGNIVYVSMFQYQIDKNLFSSVGDIKVVDIKKNKYFFKEIHADTKNNEIIGSDVSVILDQENFGVSKESDPRFVANDIYKIKDKSSLSKATFTVCKERKEKCPPWALQAKKITHDQTKKIIYYEHAVLKLYNIPIFYAPRFFHPDPTVKRQSGFLAPVFTDSTTVGTGFGLPYFWAISNDKDLTFTPKTYANENILFLNEYRQAFRNGFLTLDTSYTEGYKDINSKKTPGSRNHIFAKLDFDLSKDSYNSNLSFKVQQTSNDTYFRVHDINTALVDSENTNLENKISYNFSKNNMFLDISATAYENLRSETNDRNEYILPNIMYGKTFFTEKLGTFDFRSNALYKNYDADKHYNMFTNDVVWNPGSKITKSGFMNTLQGMFVNRNYEARNTTDYKTSGPISELTGVLSFKSALPM